MAVVVWIVEGTWHACVDAARAHTPADRPAEGWGRDPGTRLEHLAAASAQRLLQDAADRLGRPCARTERTGRVEREVVAAAEGCDLLVLARDGDRTHLGPHSLGPAARFVVDHAPCPVLLVWPEAPPGLPTMPQPPDHHHA